MTNHERIWLYRARIGTAREQLGDRAALATLVRIQATAFDLPSAKTRERTVDFSEWGVRPRTDQGKGMT
jgi:hypothetical protein